MGPPFFGAAVLAAGLGVALGVGLAEGLETAFGAGLGAALGAGLTAEVALLLTPKRLSSLETCPAAGRLTAKVRRTKSRKRGFFFMVEATHARGGEVNGKAAG